MVSYHFSRSQSQSRSRSRSRKAEAEAEALAIPDPDPKPNLTLTLGEFDRDELRSLLNALHPEQPVEDSMLDQLLERATGVYTASLTLVGDKRHSKLISAVSWCLSRSGHLGW